MLRFKRSVAFLWLLSIFVSCQREAKIEGYTRDINGFYYQLISFGEGNEHPSLNDVVVADAVMRTQSDSVFWDTFHDASGGLFISPKSAHQGSFHLHLLKLTEGDSASFLMKPSVFFREYFDTVVPQFCARDTMVKLNIKITQIMSAQEYKELKRMSKEHIAGEDKELQELQLIDRFLVKNKKNSKPDAYGIYILQKTGSGLEKVAYGKRIVCSYSGSFLDGRPFEKPNEKFEFIYGTPDQLIKGLNIVIGSLKKGETAKIILPSRLAFGESGSSNGSIPPYTPLIYDIKIIDIK